MTVPETTGNEPKQGLSKAIAEVFKAFAMESFWKYIKLGDLPPWGKGAVSLCFMIFVGCTVLALVRVMPWWAALIMFIYMTLFYFACMVWSTLNEQKK